MEGHRRNGKSRISYTIFCTKFARIRMNFLHENWLFYEWPVLYVCDLWA